MGLYSSTPEVEEIKAIQKQKRGVEERRAFKRAKKNLLEFDTEESEEILIQESDEDEDAACLYCNGLYTESRRNDFWIRKSGATSIAQKSIEK